MALLPTRPAPRYTQVMRYRLSLEELTGSQYLQPGGSFAFRASILRSASVSGKMASAPESGE